jgi:hypothetical protein
MDARLPRVGATRAQPRCSHPTCRDRGPDPKYTASLREAVADDPPVDSAVAGRTGEPVEVALAAGDGLPEMTGDGLQNIVLLANGNVSYLPNLGYNRWTT